MQKPAEKIEGSTQKPEQKGCWTDKPDAAVLIKRSSVCAQYIMRKPDLPKKSKDFDYDNKNIAGLILLTNKSNRVVHGDKESTTKLKTKKINHNLRCHGIDLWFFRGYFIPYSSPISV